MAMEQERILITTQKCLLGLCGSPWSLRQVILGEPASTKITGGIFEMLRAGGRPTSAMTSIVNTGRAGISWHAVHRPCSVHSESLTVDGNGDMDSWFGGWSLDDRCFDCIILVSVLLMLLPFVLLHISEFCYVLLNGNSELNCRPCSGTDSKWELSFF